MSEQFNNENRGALFLNDRKKTDKHPDFTGKIDVNGTEFYISAWKKVAQSGKKFMSLSVQPVQEKETAPQATETAKQLDVEADW